MAERRQITITLDGREFSFPSSMNILRIAEHESGISTPQALQGDQAMSAGFVQGIVTAGLRHCGEDVSYEQVGEMIGWEDLEGIYLAIMRALAPDIVEGLEKKVLEDSPGTGSE